MQHFLSVNDVSADGIYAILDTAEALRKKPESLTGQYFAANLFFEPSTRTRMSFHVAERKLGIDPLELEPDLASIVKGESPYDTARTYEAIGADIMVVRHANDHWYDELLGKVSVPLINAGSGKDEHPTQSMLDLLTIYQEFGRFNDLTIVIAGDIKHSRVARSNAHALKKLGATVYFAAPPGLGDASLAVSHLSIDEACEMCDVLMLLRVQHERHTAAVYDTSSYLSGYGLTTERERSMKEHAIIMHPAPVNRGVEMDTRLVECSRSRIFKQMENGVYVRMAIMAKLLNWRGVNHEHFTDKRQAITI
ncbi:aspartate carbamoyltransferase catalytic subunit [Lentibacillus salinarum]|uniref:Aspartate carbamoyltransferase n=1 Tax=Lentibacillus salinarum TaxID=446820 RepID=A0ABW3ZPM8_9BACI